MLAYNYQNGNFMIYICVSKYAYEIKPSGKTTKLVCMQALKLYFCNDK